MLCNKPRLTEHKQNALYMHCKNETALFMKQLSNKDHHYLMQEAQKVESSGVEHAWPVELVNTGEEAVQMLVVKDRTKQSPEFILTPEGLGSITGKVAEKLNLQVDKWLALPLKHLVQKKKSQMKWQDEMLLELKEVPKLYNKLSDVEKQELLKIRPDKGLVHS
ncbi:hypothetical protein OE88DRAFT_1644319 [Heliocybe sulcata]|uniref:Uncharacterized protein n=1 Tax=Heliocybe sulcata TaxID=5364 RepID=A0A5C3N3S4_9AGAM|nr:hypothetical protein OE88DRAFT_1644319 [Heliocybe sulcata]